jgi:hypothetical protein
MGRARSQTDAAVDGFAAVLGTRRGSPTAQAQRDAEERRVLEAALSEFATNVGAHFPTAFGVVDALAEAYRKQEPPTVTAERIFERMKHQFIWDIEELVTAARVGDPENAPGLVAPVQLILNQWFRRENADPDFHPQLRRTEHAKLVIDRLFGPEDEDEDGMPIYRERASEFYLTWGDLVADLGAVIAKRESGGSAQGLGFAAIRAMRMAPGGVLAGSMRSWVRAFSRLIAAGDLTGREKMELEFLLACYTVRSEGGRALAPLRKSVRDY